MVDKAEQLLLDLGFHQLRVRIHGTLARIEVLPDELQKVLEKPQPDRESIQRIRLHIRDPWIFRDTEWEV